MEGNKNLKCLEIKRGIRFSAALIHAFLFMILVLTLHTFISDFNNPLVVILYYAVPLIVNLFLMITKSTTFGGLIIGYKFVNKDTQENLNTSDILRWILFLILAEICYTSTLGIFLIFDICTLPNRNGSFPEKWSGVKKIITK